MNKLILTAFLFAASAIGQVVNPGGGASYPGVTSDGANGFAVTGKVSASNFVGPVGPTALGTIYSASSF